MRPLREDNSNKGPRAVGSGSGVLSKGCHWPRVWIKISSFLAAVFMSRLWGIYLVKSTGNDGEAIFQIWWRPCINYANFCPCAKQCIYWIIITRGSLGGMSTKNMKQAQTSAAISGQKTERKKRRHLLVLRGGNAPRKLRNTRHEGEPITCFEFCFFFFWVCLDKKKKSGWDRDQYIYMHIYNYIYTYIYVYTHTHTPVYDEYRPLQQYQIIIFLDTCIAIAI